MKNMISMKFFSVAAIASVLLVGCGKKDDALPAECQAYMDKVTACVSKAGAGAEQFKQALEASKQAWKGQDSAALAASCKQANDMFKQAAAALKCE